MERTPVGKKEVERDGVQSAESGPVDGSTYGCLYCHRLVITVGVSRTVTFVWSMLVIT